MVERWQIVYTVTTDESSYQSTPFTWPKEIVKSTGYTTMHSQTLLRSRVSTMLRACFHLHTLAVRGLVGQGKMADIER